MLWREIRGAEAAGALSIRVGRVGVLAGIPLAGGGARAGGFFACLAHFRFPHDGGRRLASHRQAASTWWQ